MASALQFAVTKRFLLSIGISIPVAAAVGIVYSFRFAGPIYSLHRFFKGLEDQPWDRRCSLRKGDDLQDVCTSINVGFDKLRSALRESREICAQIQGGIAKGEIGAKEGGTFDLKAFGERASSLERLLSARFPNDPPQDAVSDVPDSPDAAADRAALPVAANQA